MTSPRVVTITLQARTQEAEQALRRAVDAVRALQRAGQGSATGFSTTAQQAADLAGAVDRTTAAVETFGSVAQASTTTASAGLNQVVALTDAAAAETDDLAAGFRDVAAASEAIEAPDLGTDLGGALDTLGTSADAARAKTEALGDAVARVGDDPPDDPFTALVAGADAALAALQRGETGFDQFLATIAETEDRVQDLAGALGNPSLQQGPLAAVDAIRRTGEEIGRAASEGTAALTQLSGSALTAAADIGNTLTIAVRAARVELGRVVGANDLADQARQAAIAAGDALARGLEERVAALRTQLADGLISPEEFRARAAEAMQAFRAEVEAQVAQFPPVPIPVVPGQLSASEVAAAAAAVDATLGPAAATAALDGLTEALQRTKTELAAGQITATEFGQAIAGLEQEALDVASSTNLTAEEITKLNTFLQQTQAAGAQAFAPIAESIRLAEAEFRAGIISAEQYQERLLALRNEALALSDALGSLSGRQLIQVNTILRQTETGAAGTVRGFGQVRNAVFTLATQVTGLNSALGRVASGLLLFAGGAGPALAAAAVLGVLALAYQEATRATSRLKNEQDDLIKSFNQPLPRPLQAQTIQAVAPVRTSELERQRQIIGEIQRVLDALRFAPLIGSAAGGGALILAGQLDRVKQRLDAIRLAAAQAAVELAALPAQNARDEAEALGQLLQAGNATNAQRRQAVVLLTELRTLASESSTDLTVQSQRQAELDALQVQHLRDLLSVRTDLTETEREAQLAQAERVLAETRETRLLQQRAQAQQALNALQTQLRADPVGDARRQARVQAAQQDLQVEQTKLRAEEAANEQSFARQETTLRDFFARRRELVTRETEVTVTTLLRQLEEVERRPLRGSTERDREADRASRDAEAARLRAQVEIAQREGQTRRRAAEAEESQAVQQLQEQRLQVEQQIQEAQGQTFQAAQTAIDLQIARLRQAGIGEDQLGTLRESLSLQAEAADTQQQAEREIAQLQRDREAIQNQITSGQVTERQGTEAIAQLERDRLPTLRALAATFAAIAEQRGDPAAIEQARALTAQLDALAASADLAGQRTAALRDEVLDTFQGDLSTFLGSTISQVESLEEAFRSLGQAIAASFQQFAADELLEGLRRAVEGVGQAQNAAQALVDRGFNVSPVAALEPVGTPDLTDDAAALTAAAATLQAPATTLQTGSATLGVAASGLTVPATTLTTGAGTLLTAGALWRVVAAQIQAAAIALLAAGKAAGGGGGGDATSGISGSIIDGIISGAIPLASGGLVPVRLSDGEWRFDPRTVAYYGLDFFHRLNRIERRADGRYADGGPVRGPGTGTSDSVTTHVPAGSFILRERARRQIPDDVLWKITTRQLPRGQFPAFAGGGAVGGPVYLTAREYRPAFALGGSVSAAPPASQATLDALKAPQRVSVDTRGEIGVALRVDREVIAEVVDSTIPVHVTRHRRDYRDLLGGQA